MRFMRAVATLVLLGAVAWAAWFIAFYAGQQSSGATVPPPPGIAVTQPG
jgi:hypothetical protein